MVKIERWYFLKGKGGTKGGSFHPKSRELIQNAEILLVAILGQPSVALVGRRSDHVLIPFDLLKAGLHIQRCQNWKILLFNGKEERRAISSKEVIQNAEILFSVLQWQRDAVAIKAFPHTYNILNFAVLLIEPLFYLFEKNQKNYKWYKVWVHKECFFAICSWTVVPYFEDVFILILGEAWKTLGLKISLMAALFF